MYTVLEQRKSTFPITTTSKIQYRGFVARHYEATFPTPLFHILIFEVLYLTQFLMDSIKSCM